MQMLTPEDVVLRQLLVEILAEIKHPAATTALVSGPSATSTPTCAPSPSTVLQGRPRDDYREVLLRALRHPLPMLADHAAEALVALDLREAVPSLVAMLKEPDPATPYPGRDGRPLVREVVRTNHLANCLLCHPPSVTYVDPVPGVVPNARWLYPIVTTSPVVVSRTVLVNNVVGVVGGRRVPQTIVTPVTPAQPVKPTQPAQPGPGAGTGTAKVNSTQAQQVIDFVNSLTSQTTSNGTTQQTGCHDYTALAGLLNNLLIPSTPPSPGKTAPPNGPSPAPPSPATGAKKAGTAQQGQAAVSQAGSTHNAGLLAFSHRAPQGIGHSGGGGGLFAKGGRVTPRTLASGTRPTTPFGPATMRGFGGGSTPITQTAIVPRTDVTVVNLPLVVRGDVTYLRQDFSVTQDVADPNDPEGHPAHALRLCGADAPCHRR